MGGRLAEPSNSDENDFLNQKVMLSEFIKSNITHAIVLSQRVVSAWTILEVQVLPFFCLLTHNHTHLGTYVHVFIRLIQNVHT